MKVLVAEDDRMTREGLTDVLESDGYQVRSVPTGSLAIAEFNQWQPDFVCLDIMMPGESGYEVCRHIRQQAPTTPVIFISAKAEEIDRLVGFEVGADDFIVKPFSVREVSARVRAVARRCLQQQPDPPAQFTMGNLTVLPGELRARRGDETIDLSPRDVSILRCLNDHAGKPVTRAKLYETAWEDRYFAGSRTLDQHVSQLRKRIEEDPRHPQLIATVHGVGYRYDPADEST